MSTLYVIAMRIFRSTELLNRTIRVFMPAILLNLSSLYDSTFLFSDLWI